MDKSLKKIEKRKNRTRWISIFLVATIAYGFGLITAQYHIFPYRQIRYIKNIIIPDERQPIKAGEKETSSYYLDKTSFFKVNGSKADVVMIGDSITDRAEWHDLFPNISIVNRGVSGDTTKGVLNRMESITSTNAKKAFIMIGVNDLGRNASVDEIFSNYKKIVAQLKQHEIKPYIQSVVLVGDKHAYKLKHIVKLNLKLKEFSEKENIVFIDLNKVLSENGRLKESFSSTDDIHLNGYGYAVWKDSIKKYIK